MAKLSVLGGATSQSVLVFIQDSSSTTGAGLSGLVYNTAGLAAYYSFAGAACTATVITLATLAGVTSAWSSGGFIEVDATHMKGWYRFDVPNVVIAAASGRSVGVHLYGAANMAPLPLEIELTGWDNQDGVHGGMTALPNAAATAAGGLPVSIAGGLDLDEMNTDIEAIQTSTAGLTYTVSNKVDANVLDWNGTAVASPATAGIPDVNVKNIAGATAQIDGSNYLKVDTEHIKGGASVGSAGYVAVDWAGTTNPMAVIALSGTTIGTLTTYTGNTPQTGDSYARLGAPAGASIAADLAEIEGETDGIAAIPTTPVLTAHFDTIIGTPAGASVSADIAEIEAETDGIAAIPTNNGTNQTGDTYGLLTGANTELVAIPASTAKIIDMLKWLFLLARNKITQTSTTTLARNDGDSATVGTSTISDDGTTFTRGKFS